MNEDRCECHWSGVVCSVNLKRKARLKFSFCRMHVLWGSKLQGNCKIALNIVSECILTVCSY